MFALNATTQHSAQHLLAIVGIGVAVLVAAGLLYLLFDGFKFGAALGWGLGFGIAGGVVSAAITPNLSTALGWAIGCFAVGAFGGGIGMGI